MSEIKTEHGGDSDPSLKEYYRNEGFVQSSDFDMGFNNNYSAGLYAIKDPGDPNNKMIVRAEPVLDGAIFDFGVVNIQPGGSGIFTDERYDDLEREVVIDTVHVEGTGNATTGKYRVKTRNTENSFIPKTGQPISFSDLYGTKKELDGYSFDSSIGKLYITVTKDHSLSNMDTADNDFLLDYPGSNIDREKFIPLVTAKNLLENSGIYQDKRSSVKIVEFIIPAGTIVYSPDSTRPAFDIDGISSDIKIILNLGGRIVGGGGNGGDGDYDGASASRSGKDGSTGLRVNHDGEFVLSVSSESEYAICGGGGGGAAGYYRFSDGKVVGAGGGGGAGRSLGGAARYDSQIVSKSAYPYNASNTATTGFTPNGLTNHISYYLGNSPYWDRLEGLDELVDRFVDDAYYGQTSLWADRESGYSSRHVSGWDADRRAMSTNSARVTTTGYKEINEVVRARQQFGGAGAGGSLILKTNPQWHGVNLPYTKPDYIHETNDFFTREDPRFVQNVPEGFTNGWIIEHIDGTGGGYYAIVEEGKVIYSDYSGNIRNLKAIGLEAQDNYGVGAYRYGMRLAQTFTGTRQLQDAEVTRSWIWYERVDFTDDGAPPMQPNQTNYDLIGFRAGNGNPSNPPYYHGGGFTKSNNTSSAGDVHKYLYYPVKKFDQGIVRMFFPNNSTTTRNGWPAPNNNNVSGITVSSGANGSVKGNPGSTNLSYPTAIPSNGNGERRMHASYTDLSIGGYGGCTKSPAGGEAGIGYSLLVAPTFPGITGTAGDLRRTYQHIYGGGAGGGDFGSRGGDAVGIHWSGPNSSTATSYKAYGGRGGFAIEVNKAEHLITNGASTVPKNKTHGRIVIAGQTDVYTGIMTTGYNTFQRTGDPKTRFEAGYGSFSLAPNSYGRPDTVESPYGDLPNRDEIDADNGNEYIVHIKAEGYTDGSDMILTFELWGVDVISHLYNGGWENLQIGGITYNRSDATFENANLLFPVRRWKWNLTSNPFGTSRGAAKTISIG
jgi:hypothetical protein